MYCILTQENRVRLILFEANGGFTVEAKAFKLEGARI